MNLAEFPHLKLFTEMNEDTLVRSGGIGFGRKGVGIFDSRSDCWIGFIQYDSKTYDILREHKGASLLRTQNAYHKDAYFFIMTPRNGGDEMTPQLEVELTKELEGWIGKVNSVGYQLKTITRSDGLAALLGRGTSTERMVVDK